MTVTQELLREHVERRVHRCRPQARHHLDRAAGPAADLAALRAEIAAEADETTVVAVLKRFDLAEWVPATVAFAAGLDPSAARDWLGAFTRTVFLTGNPANLAGRFAFAATAPSGALAWTAPAPAAATRPLRRLLRPFEAPQPVPPAELTLDLPGTSGTPRRHLLALAVGGLTVTQAVVHLNHLLVEAVLDGGLAPGDRLVLRTVPRLVGLPGPFHALRVAVDPAHPDRLRAYACLTEEPDRA